MSQQRSQQRQDYDADQTTEENNYTQGNLLRSNSTFAERQNALANKHKAWKYRQNDLINVGPGLRQGGSK